MTVNSRAKDCVNAGGHGDMGIYSYCFIFWCDLVYFVAIVVVVRGLGELMDWEGCRSWS